MESCGERSPPGACAARAAPTAASWRITANSGEPARRSNRARHSATSSGRFFASRKAARFRSEEHTSELQSRFDLVCSLLLEKKKKNTCRVMSLRKKNTDNKNKTQ